MRDIIAKLVALLASAEPRRVAKSGGAVTNKISPAEFAPLAGQRILLAGAAIGSGLTGDERGAWL